VGSRANLENNRRNFLRLGISVVSGIAVPMVLPGCGGDEGDEGGVYAQQTFVQPTMLEAKNGLLDVVLTAAYLDTTLSGADKSNRYAVSLRSYGYDGNPPSYAGPTLVVRGGEQLRIKLVNHLPVNPPFAAFRDPTNYMKPNTTNLHTHGLHVFPGIYEDKRTLEYGDYVVDPNNGGVIAGGDSRQYVYNLPVNHPAGPFYYHPQYHGSSAIQAASLMTGAIMVRGEVDDLPEMVQATELIFLFQAPYFANDRTANNYGAKDGSLEKFSQIANHPTGYGLKNSYLNDGYVDAQPVLINGVRQPTIVMESGEVQCWRFINTQIFNCLNVNLDNHVLHQYTLDGWGSSAYQEYPDSRQKGGRGIILSPGNRSSVIVRAGAPGVYLLRSLPVKISQGSRDTVLPGDVLAKIVVIDARKKQGKELVTAASIPATPLPISDFLKPIGDEEFASAGGKKRSIIFNMHGNEVSESSSGTFSALDQAIASGSIMASDFQESIKKNISEVRQKVAKVTGNSSESSVYIAPNPIPRYDYQLQPSNTIIQNVILGAVEEWTIFNCNSISHSFHIHVNPMYVTKVNGVSVRPYWCDTIALPSGGTAEQPTSITFRMRFADFTGPFLMHCQMLQHSDLGMIQRITVVPA